MPRIKTFYDELQIERDATNADIKHAFKEIAKLYHPDKNPPEKQAWAHEQMSRFNFIFETLINPDSRKEYDEIVRKYEEAPPAKRRTRRAEKEETAIALELALVSNEIVTLSGKYSNCRLKMAIGAVVGSVAATLHLIALFTDKLDDYPVTISFSYFFMLVGGVLIIMGIADYFGRGQYKRRIDELEERRSFLRQRMYEAFVS